MIEERHITPSPLTRSSPLPLTLLPVARRLLPLLRPQNPPAHPPTYPSTPEFSQS
ncbi:MAG: hypothetical protein K6T90_15340 [Leptolyngbyaceae cyanobacterium HOT.MB2.61]|nr:hypothetical protein [Leptolyngbyaceae cyanobacterium HOT.MB2.61]